MNRTKRFKKLFSLLLDIIDRGGNKMTEEKLDKAIDLLENISKRLDEQEKRLSNLENKSPENEPKPTLIKESSREFFLRYAPQKDTDKTLVVIHFLELKGVREITTKEIAATLSEMREVVPKNIADKIQLLDKRGFLIRAEQKKEGLNCWNLSQSGKNHLEDLKNGRNK